MLATQPETWTIGRILQWTAEYFSKKDIASPRLDAEILLSHVLGCERIMLYAHFDRPLESDERATFRQLVKRRALREPVAYILGNWGFYGRDFLVDPSVLIPRPETEHIIETVLRLCEGGFQIDRILDIGTGSGCIGITLAAELKERGQRCSVVATDIEAAALAIAQKNARIHQVDIDFRQGSLFEPIQNGENFDLIVSNPPYVETGFQLEPEIAKFEPKTALFAGTEGLSILKPLIAQCPLFLKPRGKVLLEFGTTQAIHLKEDAETAFAGAQIQVIQDLAKHDRVLFIDTQH